MVRISSYLISMIAILMLVAYGIGCAGEKPPTSPGRPVTDYVSLTDNLRKAGATVEPAGEVTQPFFSASGTKFGIYALG